MSLTPGREEGLGGVVVVCHSNESTPPGLLLLHCAQHLLHSFLIKLLKVGPGETLVAGVVYVQHTLVPLQY